MNKPTQYLQIKAKYREFKQEFLAETLIILWDKEPSFALKLASKMFVEPTEEQVYDICERKCKVQGHGPLLILRYPD